MKILSILNSTTALVAILVAAGILSTGCSSQDSQQQSSEDTYQREMNDSGDQDQLYTCPMHPEVVSETPGECPECGMDLVATEQDMEHDEHPDQQESDMDHSH